MSQVWSGPSRPDSTARATIRGWNRITAIAQWEPKLPPQRMIFP